MILFPMGKGQPCLDLASGASPGVIPAPRAPAAGGSRAPPSRLFVHLHPFPWTQGSPWIPQPFPAAELIGLRCQAGSRQDFNYVLSGARWPVGRDGLGAARAVIILGLPPALIHAWIHQPPRMEQPGRSEAACDCPCGAQSHLRASPLLVLVRRERRILLIPIHGFLPDVVRSSGVGREGRARVRELLLWQGQRRQEPDTSESQGMVQTLENTCIFHWDAHVPIGFCFLSPGVKLRDPNPILDQSHRLGHEKLGRKCPQCRSAKGSPFSRPRECSKPSSQAAPSIPAW